jgi:3-oxoacyl-[acyl-carrier protein] reductase
MKKKMILTGSEGSIGSQIYNFLKKKYDIIRIDKIKNLSKSFYSCDLTNPIQTSKVFKKIKKKFKKVDLLINCAGKIHNEPFIKYDKNFSTHSIKNWNSTINNNLNATFYSNKFFLDNFCLNEIINDEKLIINFSSINSKGVCGQAAYGAGKSAIETFSRVLSQELGFLKIRVVCIAPGYFDLASTNRNLSKNNKASIINETPLRRFGKIKELIKAINFIISNKFFNGKTLKIDGGL